MIRVRAALTILALLPFFAACGDNAGTGGSAANNTAELNKARLQEFYDKVINTGNFAAADSFMTAGFIDYDTIPGQPGGVEGFRQFFTQFRAGFPDLNAKVDFVIAEGDRAAAYVTFSGTHKGEFMGMKPTGKSFSVKAVDIVEIKDGKATAHWGVFDSMGMMQQLGAMGGPQAGGGQPAAGDSTSKTQPADTQVVTTEGDKAGNGK